jgi:hypothetical protein
LKIREALFPLIVSKGGVCCGPGPWIVSVLEIASSPAVNVIVAGVGVLNIMISPELALAIVSLSDPGPLSAVLVTVTTEKALACRVITPALSVSRANRNIVANIARILVKVDVFIDMFSEGLA